MADQSSPTADSLHKITLEKSMVFKGDALRVLRLLPASSFRACVTSPPYWGLRDYGIKGQIGAEPELESYLQSLVAVFGEVKRVLKDDGTLWLNIGDAYTSGDREYRAPDKKHTVRAMDYRPKTPPGLKPKDQIGIPWRLAFALQRGGWYLRRDIIWEKPNAMPESVKDRPTESHEYIFLLSKSLKYYYDSISVREGNKNLRSVWHIKTEPLRFDHSASFPGKLVEPCIRAGTKKGDYVIDPFFGSGTVGIVCGDLGRRYVGIELNPEYVKIARQRLWSQDAGFYDADEC